MPLTKEQRIAIGNWFGLEIRNAEAARQSNTLDVDYWWSLYEQARTRLAATLPWPDAADLTSYIPCEKVDAVHARIMRTIWVNPVWTVEGFGPAADRAPYVEEFHQWKVEEERFQSVCDRWALAGLVEPVTLLEVYESTQKRRTRKEITAKATTTAQGGTVYDAKGNPLIEPNPDSGEFDQAQPNDPGVQTIVDSYETVRKGPQYRVIKYADNLILPGHATHKDEIWGYCKRVHKLKRDLTADAANGMYDKEAVDGLTDVGDRQQTPALLRANQAVAPQQTKETAEKELWEGLICVDLNGVLDEYGQESVRGSQYDGPRWYVITIHLLTNTILRVDHDDFARSRYVPLILFPRHDRATEGYSLVGHKLLTITEEHTAYRNMAADRSSLAVNAPIKKVAGALWDEDEQPWGPKAVITVRDHKEIEQQQVNDVPQSVFAQIQYCDRTAERLAGVNDIASGQVVQQGEARTLGEVQMATEQSFVRMDLIVRRFQEALEDVGQIRHAMWVRCLAEQQYGVDAPDSLIVGLEGRGESIDTYLPDGKITAALLDGPFRFRPYGSVETANPARRRNDLLQFLGMLPRVEQTFPSLVPQFQQPRAARAFMREVLQAFAIHNRQAFLGSPTQDLAAQQQLNALPAPSMMPAPPPMPGMAGPGMGGMVPHPPMPGQPPQGAQPPMPPMPQMPPMAQGPTGPQ